MNKPFVPLPLLLLPLAACSSVGLYGSRDSLGARGVSGGLLGPAVGLQASVEAREESRLDKPDCFHPSSVDYADEYTVAGVRVGPRFELTDWLHVAAGASGDSKGSRGGFVELGASVPVRWGLSIDLDLVGDRGDVRGLVGLGVKL